MSVHSACPARVLVWVNVIFGMRHQAEHISLWIAYAGDIEYRTIGVDRIFSICRRTVLTNISESDLVLGIERGKWKMLANLKVSFPMGDRSLDEFIQSFCPDAGLVERFESHPAALEMSLSVKG